MFWPVIVTIGIFALPTALIVWLRWKVYDPEWGPNRREAVRRAEEDRAFLKSD